MTNGSWAGQECVYFPESPQGQGKQRTSLLWTHQVVMSVDTGFTCVIHHWPEVCSLWRSLSESSPGRAECAAPPLVWAQRRGGRGGSSAARERPACRTASGCWCRTPRWTERSPPGSGGRGAGCWACPMLCEWAKIHTHTQWEGDRGHG